MNTCFQSIDQTPVVLPAIGTHGDYVMPPIISNDGKDYHAPGFRVACKVIGHIGTFGLQLKETLRPAFAIECHYSSFEADKQPRLIVTKTVEWSYSTSENAKRFGFKQGCYTVSLNERSEEGTTITARAVKGFLTRYNALSYARTLPEPWSIHFLRVYPEDAV